MLVEESFALVVALQAWWSSLARAQPPGGVIQLDQNNPISINDFLGRFNALAQQGKGRSERKRMSIREGSGA